MRTLRRLLVGAALAVASLMPAAAFGKGDFDYIAISGPGWYGDLIVSDPTDLEALDLGMLIDYKSTASISAPLGPGYLISRGYQAKDGPQIFDRVMVFLGEEGRPGLAYYIEIVNGSGPYDGRWFHTTAEGEASMRQLIAKQAGGTAHLIPVEQAAEAGAFPFWTLAILPALAAGWLLGNRMGRLKASPAS